MPTSKDYNRLQQLIKPNKKTVELTKKEIAQLAKAKWYNQTYKLFINHSLNDMSDFWKIVAFAYSWMPTIPNINIQQSKLNDDLEFWKNLNRLRNGSEMDRKAFLEKLVPNINNSVVGTSKVLHFIAPDYVPILDSKVLSNWNWFFKNTETPTFSKTLSASNQIRIYLQYWKLMEEWKNNCKKAGKDVSLRALEKSLFTLKTNT